MNNEMLHACDKVNGRPKNICVSIIKQSPIESFIGCEGGILLWYQFPYDAMYFSILMHNSLYNSLYNSLKFCLVHGLVTKRLFPSF